MRPTVLSLALLAPALSFAAGDKEQAVHVDASAPMEVLVVSDPWARWDHTRWRLDTQVGLPYPGTLYAEVNHELQMVAYDLRAVIACELGARINKRLREVDCVIEDAAISAAPMLESPRQPQAILDETDEHLTGLMIRLQVHEDGRVTNLNLLDEPQGNRRVNVMYENLRQLLSRAVVGFHLQAPDSFVLGEEWLEKNSRLFSLPSFRWYDNGRGGFAGVGGADDYLRGGDTTVRSGAERGTRSAALSSQTSDAGGIASVSRPDFPDGLRSPYLTSAGTQPFDLLQAPASMGHSVVAHRMDNYRGRYLVQSNGRGTVDIGVEAPITFQGELDAVSVFDGDTGVMTERVWTLRMDPTAGSVLADGPAGWSYWHLGRLRRLGEDEETELGPSLVVAPPTTNRGQLPPWPVF